MPFDPAQFKRTLVFQDRAPFADLNAAFDQIRQFDQMAEAKGRRIRWTMLWAFLGVPVCFLAAVAFESPMLLLVMIGCLVTGIVAVVQNFRHSKYDLPNRRHELAWEMIRALSRDMKKDAAIDTLLVLSPIEDRQKQIGKNKVNAWDVTYYEDPWLRLSGQLADGTAFQISLLERFQSRHKRKRSSSGKIKTKYKSKCATFAIVQLSPRPKAYPQLAAVESRVKDFVRIPAWAMVKSTQGKPGRLTLKIATSADWAVKPYSTKTQHDGRELLFSMLHSLYQALHESQTIAAK